MLITFETMVKATGIVPEKFQGALRHFSEGSLETFMGAIYELISTPPAYLKKAFVKSENAGRSSAPVKIPFGSNKLQHCVLWEPDKVTHDECVMYFHGGAYLVGAPESMIDAANVYNSQGYRFCSVGFRLMPFHRFPAQVEDAFTGIAAARAWLKAHGRPYERFFVGGSSCGGHLATLVGYAQWLQEKYHISADDVAGVISVAAVVDADDMLLKPFPRAMWPKYIDLRAGSDAESRHRALLPFSPYDLLEKWENAAQPDVQPSETQAGTQADVQASTQPDAQSPKSLPPFFAIHGSADTMSPYNHEVKFVERLNKIGGPGTATMCTVDDPVWQHMWTTVTLHKDEVDSSMPLKRLFEWLEVVENNPDTQETEASRCSGK